MKNTIYILVSAFIFLSCPKENSEKMDQVSTQDVKGMVFNNCTDSGLAGVKVYLHILQNQTIVEKFETISGDGGNFIFSNAPIHSDEKFTYAIYIPSKSGTNATEASQARFDGTTIYFTKSEFYIFLKPRVTPGFLLYTIYYLTTPTITDDSILVYYEQKKFHKNVPDLPYKLGGGGYGNYDKQSDFYGDYPMGEYFVTINKYKSGTHTINYDTIYLGWGATQSHTINW